MQYRPLLALKFLVAGIFVGIAAILLAFYSAVTKLSLIEHASMPIKIRSYSCQIINIKWFGPVRIDVYSKPIVKVEIYNVIGKSVLTTFCSNKCDFMLREISYIRLCSTGVNNVTVYVTVYKYGLVMPNTALAPVSLILGFIAIIFMMLSLRGLRR